MAAEFSKVLARARREAGFKTAYQFYHGNGGRRHFPFTYVHYLRLENAGRLPRPAWMGRLVTALRLSPGAEGFRKFFLAYLRDLLGGAEAAELILEPLLCRHGSPAAAASASALRWMKAEHAAHLTPAQFKAAASSEAAYWCYEVLCNDEGAWTAENLAGRLKLAESAVRAGLARLKRAGLARAMSSGRFRGRQPGKLHTFPGRLEGLSSELARVQGYWDKMRRRRGADISARVELVRAEAGFMRRYAEDLSAAVEQANAGAVRSAGEDTGLYAVEARVRRLSPF